MSPMTTAAHAEQAIDELAGLIEQLSDVIEQETMLVHAGRIRAASALQPAKAELAGRLFAAGERLKRNAKFVKQAAPTRCAALARLHETFAAVLHKNIIVLATVHAVSEGIVRRLSSDLARKASPQVYGAAGRATAPSPKHCRPLALSRVL